jgi:hypothetical protein
LRYRIDKLFDITKSDQRSVTPCDVDRKDEYIQYLFNTKNGNQRRLVSQTIDTTDHIARAQNVSEEFAKTRKAKKDTGPTTWDLAEQLIYAVANDPEVPQTEHAIYAQYVQHAVEIHRKHKKPFCDFSIVKVIQTAMSGSKRDAKLVHRSIMARLTPRN